jgi:hypothetical protein
MNRFFFFLIASMFAVAGSSQTSSFDSNLSGGNSFANDVNGRPLYLKTEYNADGSPYLYDEYCLADITAMNGKTYKNVKAKINLQEKLLLYRLDNGEEMVMTTPVRKIRFYNYINNGVAYGERTFQGHNGPMNGEATMMYELVYEDSSAALLKLITVSYTDSKGYGEATVTRTFKKTNSYFAVIPPGAPELKKVDKNKTSVAALFGRKADAVAGFISQKKLKCRSDEDLVEVFRYYGSL